jgi:hypothetical protein
VKVYPLEEMLYDPPRFTNAPPNGFGYGYPGGVSTNGGTPDPHYYLNSYPYRYSGGYLGGYGSGGYSGGFGPGVVSQGTVMSFGDDTNTPEEKEARAEKIVDLVTELIEPEGWDRNGGDWATVRYHEGSLVVRAPDFIHRELGGYPPVPEPAEEQPEAEPASKPEIPAGAGGAAEAPRGDEPRK